MGRAALRFTGPMETTEGTILQSTEHREDALLTVRGIPVVRVRAITDQGRAQVRAEVQLLAALEVDAIAAAPEVLEIEEDGYLREGGTVLSRRGGRRCAEPTAPGTQERWGLARAREDLDALITALHQRGWVLGARLGEGLALREDGSVIMRDLSGLREDGSAMALVDDRLWVDSVLHDQDRTLRRRIDDRLAPIANHATSAEGWELNSPGEDRDRDQDQDPAVEGADQGAQERYSLPAPRALRRRRDRERTRLLGPGPLAKRRDLAAATGAVVLAGVLLGGVAWSMMPREGGEGSTAKPSQPASAQGTVPTTVPPQTAPATTEPAPTQDAPGPAVTVGPQIQDPQGLATELALARHAYVTGTSTAAITVEGSTARERDDAVREAYQGLTVTGGEPEVHSAELLDSSTAAGTARLRVETTSAAHTTVASDGTTRQVPASGPVTVDLDLRWDGSTWSIEAVTPV